MSAIRTPADRSTSNMVRLLVLIAGIACLPLVACRAAARHCALERTACESSRPGNLTVQGQCIWMRGSPSYGHIQSVVIRIGQPLPPCPSTPPFEDVWDDPDTIVTYYARIDAHRAVFHKFWGKPGPGPVAVVQLGRSVAGRVANLAGRRLVSARLEDVSSYLRIQGAVHADGRFTFDAVPPTRFVLDLWVAREGAPADDEGTMESVGVVPESIDGEWVVELPPERVPYP
jgi:hypothetical protein